MQTEKNNNRVNIVLCGVGGQGTVLASRLIADAAMEKGMHVCSAETIGMAQRGGSVFSHLGGVLFTFYLVDSRVGILSELQFHYNGRRLNILTGDKHDVGKAFA